MDEVIDRDLLAENKDLRAKIDAMKENSSEICMELMECRSQLADARHDFDQIKFEPERNVDAGNEEHRGMDDKQNHKYSDRPMTCANCATEYRCNIRDFIRHRRNYYKQSMEPDTMWCSEWQPREPHMVKIEEQ